MQNQILGETISDDDGDFKGNESFYKVLLIFPGNHAYKKLL